jgi:hypothetical protein
MERPPDSRLRPPRPASPCTAVALRLPSVAYAAEAKNNADMISPMAPNRGKLASMRPLTIVESGFGKGVEGSGALKCVADQLQSDQDARERNCS